MKYLCSYKNCILKANWICDCELIFCEYHSLKHITSSNHKVKKQLKKLSKITMKQLRNLIAKNLLNIEKEVKSYEEFVFSMCTSIEKSLKNFISNAQKAKDVLYKLDLKIENLKEATKFKADENIEILKAFLENDHFKDFLRPNNKEIEIPADNKYKKILDDYLKKMISIDSIEKCQDCGGEGDFTRKCNHFVCFYCLRKNHICNLCEQEIPFNTAEKCDSCNNFKVCKMLSCGHNLCRVCRTLAVDCNLCRNVIDNFKKNNFYDKIIIENLKENNLDDPIIIEDLKENYLDDPIIIEDLKENYLDDKIIIKEIKESCLEDKNIIKELKESCFKDKNIIEELKESRLEDKNIIEEFKEDNFDDKNIKKVAKAHIKKKLKLPDIHKYKDTNYKYFCCKKCFNTNEKQICLECKNTFCTKCSPFEEYCPYCLDTLGYCDNCEKTGMLLTLKCFHLGCYNCKDSNFCKKCDSNKNKICSNCDEHYELKAKRNCNHDMCNNCIGKQCKQCFLNQSMTKNVCNSCNIECKSIFSSYYGYEICKNCLETHSYFFNPLNDCSYCYISSRDLITLNCKHFMCKDCAYKKKSCKKCKQKKCCKCKTEVASVIANCGHEMCGKCYEKNLKCDECFIRHQMFCPNCGEQSKKNITLECDHHGCRVCKNNEICYKCAVKLKDKRIYRKFEEKCNFCWVSTIEYFYLRCGHEVCISCLKKNNNKLKNLNYSCISCITDGKLVDQICSICHYETKWVIDENYFKSCCKKAVCTKCFYCYSGFSHSCDDCVVI
ncbi:hypothetical protein SteCoe_9675 [Stentor coeruleus]|uniref:RING-type domain-containing protein n=1 Tax=Stentor coeruleus TaxID=5963 RepID=A0A1R2CH52_9CILI|nr:hypothetical protein SteCoe_9675 [Stentor coeruleus]